MTPLSLFALKLCNIRTELSYTQETMAEILGISTRWYQKLEYGRASPNFNLLCKMVTLCSIDLTEFYLEDIENDNFKKSS